MRILAVGLVFLSFSALADDAKTAADELKRGRALAAKGKHAEAVAAFDAALRAVPGEPHALLELGVELRATKDHARAETVCREVIAGNDPELSAQAHWNLGLVLEDKGDKAGAIAAFNDSLRLRKNRIVREHLQDLDPTALSSDTLPAPLERVSSLKEWCAKQPDCSLEDPLVGAKLDEPAKPWLEARVVTARKDDTPNECFLAVRTANGWFVGDLVYCKDGEYRHDVTASLETAAFQGTVLVVRVAGTDTYRHPTHDQDFATLWVCGVGPSGTPSCTPALDLHAPLLAKAPPEAALTYRFDADSIVFSPEDKRAPLHPTLGALAGRHRVKFP